MRTPTHSWQPGIWIACCAILINALAPSLSQALAALRGPPAGWDICRADASAPLVRPALWTPAARAVRRTDGPGKAMLVHCAYCLPHAGSDALLSSKGSASSLLLGHALRPVLVYRAPQPWLALLARAPRGPPGVG